MPRGPRTWIDPAQGSYHVISRLADRRAWFDEVEKEHFLRLLERFARGFFVQVHAFCVMSNHFHLLVTSCEMAAVQASASELRRRYRAMHGPLAEPPIGAAPDSPDADGGVARLRVRLGSVSRFVQELKQAFSRWYNARHDRHGYLWSERFKSMTVAKAGDAELVASAYIDLNPVRAALVARPEDYRWSSLGLQARAPRRAERLLTPLARPELRRHGVAWYRVFVACAGALPAPGKPGRIPAAVRDAVLARCGRIGVAARLRYRCRYLTEGLAIGTHAFVAALQQQLGRKRIRPSPIADLRGPAAAAVRAGPNSNTVSAFFATRCLPAPNG